MADIVLQSTPDDGGSKAYCGVGRIGKTTLGVNHLNAESKKTGYPKAVLDCGRSKSFLHLPHAKHVDEVLESVLSRRVDAPIWTPSDIVQRKKFFRVVQEWGGVHIFLDEIWNICDSSYVDPELVTLSNQYAHGPNGSNYLYFVAQRVMFINQKLFASIRKWHIFQSAAGAEQDTLRKMFGERVLGNEKWGRGKYEEFSRDVVTLDQVAAPEEKARGKIPDDDAASKRDDATADRSGDGKDRPEATRAPD